MISVIVTYKVNPEFVEQNRQNIQQFLADFKKFDTSQFQYNVYIKSDEMTFVHHSIYNDGNIQAELLNVPSFIEFQKARDESGLAEMPKIEVLNFVGSTNDI